MRRDIAIDVIGLAGFAAFLVGVWRIYEPAALIVGGLSVMAWAVAQGARS